MGQGSVPIDRPSSDLVQAGRDALSRHAWAEAYDLLSRAESEGQATGADLEALAEASFFAGRGDERVEIKERAFRARADEGDSVRAAFLALDIAGEHMIRGRASIASAWARRAEPLLEGVPESYAHGYLSLVRADLARGSGDLASATALADEAIAIGRRTRDPDLVATALTSLGTLKIASGSAADGIALLEEAAIAAVNGELSRVTAGITSCQMIAACRDLTDYQRAAEWLEATDKWCERQEVSGFPGICRVHRGELVALRGGWDRAEEELTKATAELRAYAAVPVMADGLYALGDLRRLKGDLDGAEEALREAHSLGRSPQPAMALLRLGQGQVKAAASAIASALREASWDQWARARLLSAQVEIAVAGADVATARAAADELAKIVEGYPSPALQAGTHEANGRALLAEGDAGAAIRELRSATRLWREVGAAHDVARVRVVLARALRAEGDEDDADLELRAARDEFERLGAKPELDAAERDLKRAAESREVSQLVHRTFLFTDIVGSTNLAEALGNDAWERLLRWHDESLRAAFARFGGTVVNSTGDGFFAAFESASSAASAAIEIQRSLAEHRASTGFAPPVRIGIHAADATVRENDFSGLGVHVAARVAALASGGEIVISREAAEDAGDVRTSNQREAMVKGVSTPLVVADLDWR